MELDFEAFFETCHTQIRFQSVDMQATHKKEIQEKSWRKEHKTTFWTEEPQADSTKFVHVTT